MISYQSTVYTPISKEISIFHFLEEIKDGTYQRDIEVLRSLKEQAREDEYGRRKKGLPAVTFCGTFNSTRSIETLKSYNEVLVIDIDKIKDEQEFQRISQCLNTDPYVFSYWISPSGNGFKGLMHIAYSRTLELKDAYLAHKFAFNCISTYFSSTHNVILDKSGSDTTRLCITSYDPELVTKESTRSFQIELPEILEDKLVSGKSTQSVDNMSAKVPLSKSILMNPNGKNDRKNKETYIKIYKFLLSKKISITSDYDSWFRIALAIANSFTHELGERYYLQLCRLDGSSHDEEKSKNLLLYCYSSNRGMINFDTILFLAKEKGFKI